MALALGERAQRPRPTLCLALLSGCTERGLWRRPACGKARELAAAVRTQAASVWPWAMGSH